MGSIEAEKFEAMKSYKEKHLLYNLILHFLTAITCSLLFSYPYWFPSLCCSIKHFFLISLPYIWSSFTNPKFLFVVVNVIILFLVGESRLVNSSSSPTDEIYDEYVKRSRSLRRVSSACKMMKEEKVEEKEVTMKQVNKVEDKEEEKEKESRENVKIVEEDEEKGGDHGEEKQSQEKVELVEEDEEKKGGHDEEEEESQEKVEIVEEDEEKEGDEEEEARLPTTIVRGEDKEENDGGGEEEGGLPAEELNKRVEEFIAKVNKQRWLEANSYVLYCEA